MARSAATLPFAAATVALAVLCTASMVSIAVVGWVAYVPPQTREPGLLQARDAASEQMRAESIPQATIAPAPLSDERAAVVEIAGDVPLTSTGARPHSDVQEPLVIALEQVSSPPTPTDLPTVPEEPAVVVVVLPPAVEATGATGATEATGVTGASETEPPPTQAAEGEAEPSEPPPPVSAGELLPVPEGSEPVLPIEPEPAPPVEPEPSPPIEPEPAPPVEPEPSPPVEPEPSRPVEPVCAPPAKAVPAPPVEPGQPVEPHDNRGSDAHDVAGIEPVGVEVS